MLVLYTLQIFTVCTILFPSRISRGYAAMGMQGGQIEVGCVP